MSEKKGKIRPKKENKGKKSVETLCHFSCGTCQKWWSISDAPRSKRVWWCPWCGEKIEI